MEFLLYLFCYIVLSGTVGAIVTLVASLSQEQISSPVKMVPRWMLIIFPVGAVLELLALTIIKFQREYLPIED